MDAEQTDLLQISNDMSLAIDQAGELSLGDSSPEMLSESDNNAMSSGVASMEAGITMAASGGRSQSSPITPTPLKASPLAMLSCAASVLDTTSTTAAFLAKSLYKLASPRPESLQEWQIVDRPVGIEPMEKEWQQIVNTSVASRLKEKESSGGSTLDFFLAIIPLGMVANASEELRFGHFSLHQPATKWCTTICRDQDKDTRESRIMESIKTIREEHGVEGVLQVLLWATIYSFQSGDSAFWNMVHKAAKSQFEEDDRYLLRVEGDLRELERTTGGKDTFPDGTPFMVEGQCFVLFEYRKMNLLAYDDGISMLWTDDE